MSIYLETDSEASLLIDAAISYQVGQPLPTNYTAGYSTSLAAGDLRVEIIYDDAVIGNTSLSIGSTGFEVPLSLDQFSAGLGGLNISIRAILNDGSSTYEASTELFKLPSPEGYGSVSRLDHLYGGLWVQRDDEDWKHIFPYTYYGMWRRALCYAEALLISTSAMESLLGRQRHDTGRLCGAWLQRDSYRTYRHAWR